MVSHWFVEDKLYTRRSSQLDKNRLAARDEILPVLKTLPCSSMWFCSSFPGEFAVKSKEKFHKIRKKKTILCSLITNGVIKRRF